MPSPRNPSPDRLATPFQIGLKPLDPEQWIEVDDQLAAYLDEKRRLEASHAGAVFAAEPDTGAAQAEVLALLAMHLPRRFPEVYRRSGAAIEIVPAGRQVRLDEAGRPPLQIAASLVQEDLVLMRRGAEGWRLAAASLCFPSAWVLAEKFGRPMHEVHAPVPGFGAGSRNAGMIERMFDHLRPEMPVIRWNWSLFGDGGLFHPEAGHPGVPRFGSGPRADSVFLRVERQTLRRLPTSGDILFTIRIHVDPLAVLERQPDAPQVAARLRGQIEALSAEQAGYKGLELERDRLLARLAEIAG